MNIQISFKPDGTALCLWTKAVPLHELGRLEIHRATNIEFNDAINKMIGPFKTSLAAKRSCLLVA
ncbi:hypothetical protein SBV1_410094 [Verrucomicrobia bacterium]|nr:hypothetical protein SBV1_410094 [Verrucomicrobiota bacterium]